MKFNSTRPDSAEAYAQHRANLAAIAQGQQNSAHLPVFLVLHVRSNPKFSQLVNTSPARSLRHRAAGRGGRTGAYPTDQPQGAASDSTPINNMGVTTDCDATALEGFQDIALADYVDLVMSDSGEVKQLLTRVPTNGQCAIIDWVNFTILEDTWFKTARQTLISDEQIMNEASRYLEKIFGFGVTLHRDKGMSFYRDSWVLGDDFGFVCFGGQRQTMSYPQRLGLRLCRARMGKTAI